MKCYNHWISPTLVIVSLFKFITVVDNAPVHKLLLSDDQKPTNINIIFLRPNCTGFIQPADLRYNGKFQTLYPEIFKISNLE